MVEGARYFALGKARDGAPARDPAVTPSIPLTRDLVLVGGGHAHALVLKRWGMAPLAGARLTLIDPSPLTAYTGMLPGFVAGHYRRDQLDIDLVKLARHAGARFVHGAVTGLDRDARTVSVGGRGPISYDVLSLDIGVHSSPSDITGADFAVAAKPLGAFASRWSAFVSDAARSTGGRTVAVIGGGVAGVELALAIAHRLSRLESVEARVMLVERDQTILSSLQPGQRRPLHAALRRQGVDVLTGRTITAIEEDALCLDGGARVEADLIVSAAGGRPYGWLAASGLDLHEGFVRVDQRLRAINDPRIFAAGDCAHMDDAPREKAGVFAVRQAPVLYHNFRAAFGAGGFRTFRPQSDYLKLVSTGTRSAVALKFGLAASGRWLWRIKDRIDRRFMDRLSDFPEMPRAPAPREAAEGVAEMVEARPPLCGGCGAKVARTTLRRGLSSLIDGAAAKTARDYADDAAVLASGDRFQTISTDHLRAFCDDPWLVSRVAAVHALGDVWSMGAAPQAALASITLPPLSSRLQERTLAEIMAAADAVFAEAGADIVGGHTSEGAELFIGFTVTGLRAEAPIGLAGAGPGDALLLTKPIGTGVILAAEMAKRANGADVIAAYRQMSRPQSRAAALLGRHARAMTDVTGFGLAGHLLNLLEASGCAATLSWDAVPIAAGAADLAGQGVRSSLWEANRSAADDAVSGVSDRHDLLFDPQTSGGLLAAVPEAEARHLVDAFHAAGETVWRIGAIETGPASITLI